MTAEVKSHAFKKNSSDALQDAHLQVALGNIKSGFIQKRLNATLRTIGYRQRWIRTLGRDVS